MAKSGWRERIFSGELDRAAFIVYFLGAVVPLIGFAPGHRPLRAADARGPRRTSSALIAGLVFTGRAHVRRVPGAAASDPRRAGAHEARQRTARGAARVVERARRRRARERRARIRHRARERDGGGRRRLCVPEGRRATDCPRSRTARGPTRSGSTPRTRARSRRSCAARWSRAAPRCACRRRRHGRGGGAAARELRRAGRDRGAAPRLRAVRRRRARRARDAREHVGGRAPQRGPARVAAQLLLARHRHARDRARRPTSASTAATVSARRSSRTGSAGGSAWATGALAPALRGAAARHRHAEDRRESADVARHVPEALRVRPSDAVADPALARSRADRLPPPRVVRRPRLPGRQGRRRDPARVADHRALRRGRQHDLRSTATGRRSRSTPRSPSSSAARAASSTRSSSPRSSSSRATA